MPAVIDHPSFVQPTDPNVWLWRYMDLSKFAALLQTQSLVFARADTLGDPFEGSVPEMNAKALEYVMALRKADPDKDPYKGMPDEQVIKMHQQMSGARKQMVKAHFISCWHMNEAESAGMWKLYSRSSDAVCVRTDYASLAAALPDDAYMGVVNYIDFKTGAIRADNMFNPYLVKRRSFAHEREARAIIVDGGALSGGEAPPLKMVQLNLNALVKAVYVSPESPDWFRDVVADLTAKYGLTVNVEHSEMNAAPLY